MSAAQAEAGPRGDHDHIVEIKRTLRRLQALEVRLRFGSAGPGPAGSRGTAGPGRPHAPGGVPLIWDAFFDLRSPAKTAGNTPAHQPGAEAAAQRRGPGTGPGPTLPQNAPPGARYPLAALAAMDRDAFRAAVAAYLANLYAAVYGGAAGEAGAAYDPALLARLGLPPGSTAAAVKRRFRQLALAAHPDTGGSAEAFMALMEDYRDTVRSKGETGGGANK